MSAQPVTEATPESGRFSPHQLLARIEHLEARLRAAETMATTLYRAVLHLVRNGEIDSDFIADVEDYGYNLVFTFEQAGWIVKAISEADDALLTRLQEIIIKQWAAEDPEEAAEFLTTEGSRTRISRLMFGRRR